MCKVLLIPGIKDEYRANAIKFVEAMAVPMSHSNSDGLGYAAVTADGKLFGQRWLNNSMAFKKIDKYEQFMYDMFQGITNVPVGLIESTSFGDTSLYDKMTAITLHTRMATSSKGMNNTHPFVKDGVSVIHNGIIRNLTKYADRMTTSCDSESILIQYLDDEVNKDPDKIKATTDALVGYYACGVLAPTDTGYIMDIFRGNGASLYTSFIVELDTYVFSTSGDDITSVCKQLGFTYKTLMLLNEGVLLRVAANSGKLLSKTSFTVGSQFVPATNYWPEKKEEPVKKNTHIPPYLMSYFKGTVSLTEIAS